MGRREGGEGGRLGRRHEGGWGGGMREGGEETCKRVGRRQREVGEEA